MDAPVETCWSLVRQSAGGDRDARARFATTYLPVVRACLAARWAGGPLLAEIDDATQETFVEFFRDRGALERVDTSGEMKFRSYLFAVTLNVARRFEERSQRGKPGAEVQAAADLPSRDERASRAFDRRWAETLLKRAAQRMESAARFAGRVAERRVELLRLRFQEGLPIRSIAERWNLDAAAVHHQYAQAREEFKRALLAEIAWHDSGRIAEAEAECRKILESLG